jgi:hypothetical protein
VHEIAERYACRREQRAAVALRHEPAGAVEWKAVEAYLRRTGRILHLHFPDGELIRTTPEYPFFSERKQWPKRRHTRRPT